MPTELSQSCRSDILETSAHQEAFDPDELPDNSARAVVVVQSSNPPSRTRTLLDRSAREPVALAAPLSAHGVPDLRRAGQNSCGAAQIREQQEDVPGRGEIDPSASTALPDTRYRSEARTKFHAAADQKPRFATAAKRHATFSPLEARVMSMAISRRERRGTHRSVRAIDRLVGRRTATSLANARLEALRSQTISLRDGHADIEPAFIAAGYTAEHATAIRAIMAQSIRYNAPAARRDRTVYAGGISLAIGSLVGFVSIAAVCII